MKHGIFRANSNIGEIEFQFTINDDESKSIIINKEGNSIDNIEWYAEDGEDYEYYIEDDNKIIVNMLNDKLHIYKDSIRPICNFISRSEYILKDIKVSNSNCNKGWLKLIDFVEEKVNTCNNKDIEDIYKLMLKVEDEIFN